MKRKTGYIPRLIDLEIMGPPSFLAVVTGTEYAYTRDYGVHVVPLGCLGP